MQHLRKLTTMEEDFKYLGIIPSDDGMTSLVKDLTEDIGQYNSLAVGQRKLAEEKEDHIEQVKTMTREAMKARKAGNIQQALDLEKKRDGHISKAKSLGYGQEAEDAATETEDEGLAEASLEIKPHPEEVADLDPEQEKFVKDRFASIKSKDSQERKDIKDQVKNLWLKGKSPKEIGKELGIKINLDNTQLGEMHSDIMSGHFEVEKQDENEEEEKTDMEEAMDIVTRRESREPFANEKTEKRYIMAFLNDEFRNAREEGMGEKEAGKKAARIARKEFASNKNINSYIREFNSLESSGDHQDLDYSKGNDPDVGWGKVETESEEGKNEEFANRVKYIFNKYGYDDNEEPASAVRIDDLKELIELVNPPNKSEWKAKVKTLDSNLHHNDAVEELENMLLQGGEVVEASDEPAKEEMISLGKGNRPIPTASEMGKWMLKQFEAMGVSEEDKEDVAKVLSSIWRSSNTIYVDKNARKYSKQLMDLDKKEGSKGNASFIDSKDMSESTELSEALKAQRLKRMKPAAKAKARRAYRKNKSKISRKLRKLHKKASYKRRQKKLKKLKHGRKAGARRRLVVSGLEAIGALAENLVAGIPTLQEEVMSKGQFLEAFAGIENIANSMCKKYAELISMNEEDEELSYVGQEWDAMDEFEDEGDDVEVDDEDLTHVGEEWDDAEDEEEGDEVEDEYEDENEKDYVGDVEESNNLMNLRCLIEDTQSAREHLKNGKHMNAKKIVSEMTQTLSKIMKTYVQEAFMYVGDDEPEAVTEKPEAPKKQNKYVGQDEPEADKEKPETPENVSGKHIGEKSFGKEQDAKTVPVFSK